MEKTIFLPEQIIDTHCHGRDMEQSYKTTVKQTLLEARRGNIGITVFMPNTDPPIIDLNTLSSYFNIIGRARISLELDRLENQQYVYFGVTDNNLDACNSALEVSNVIGLKIYPVGVTTGVKIGIRDDNTLKKVLTIASHHNKVVAIHCDDPEVIAKEGHTKNAEISYLNKVIGFLRQIPEAKVVICHVSCRESAEIILRVQNEGLKIAIEICPHYLWFDDERTNWNQNLDPVFYHCYNKLRSSEDRLFLTNLLRQDNPFILIGSDNAQHIKEEKLVKKLGGLPTNQEMVAVVITLTVKFGIPEEQLTNLLCYNASNFLGIPVIKEKKEYYLVEKTDRIEYNNGKIVNPWNGSRLIFPTPK